MRTLKLYEGIHEDHRMSDVKWWKNGSVLKYAQLQRLANYMGSKDPLSVSPDDLEGYKEAQKIGKPLRDSLYRGEDIPLQVVIEAINAYPEYFRNLTELDGIEWVPCRKMYPS